MFITQSENNIIYEYTRSHWYLFKLGTHNYL